MYLKKNTNTRITVTTNMKQISIIQQLHGQPMLVASDSPLKG
jgi:hypothetical protein